MISGIHKKVCARSNSSLDELSQTQEKLSNVRTWLTNVVKQNETPIENLNLNEEIEPVNEAHQRIASLVPGVNIKTIVEFANSHSDDSLQIELSAILLRQFIFEEV